MYNYEDNYLYFSLQQTYMIKKLVLVWTFSLICFNLFSQNINPTCGTEIIQKNYLDQHPELLTQLIHYKNQWVKEAELKQLSRLYSFSLNEEEVYEIPIVFHIIHPNSAIGTHFNPTDSDIKAVVDYINQTFASTWPNYPDVNNGGAKVHLKFVLAKRDPHCQPTNGIVRINALTALPSDSANIYEQYGIKVQSNSGLTDLTIKNLSRWDPKAYYNVWVVNKIDGWNGYVAGGGVVGFAYYPPASPDLDGTVIMEAFNKPNERTLPHEIGHSFGLRHTFQDGCQPIQDCLTTGDFICDTDPHDQTQNCPQGINPCTNTSWVPVVHNIMNYSTCSDRFTEDQAAMMMHSLDLYRSSLKTSLGSTSIGNTPTSTPPIAASCSTSTIENIYSMGINQLIIGEFSYNSPNYPYVDEAYYLDLTDTTPCLFPPLSPIELTTGNSYPFEVGFFLNPQYQKMWIDYNNDGEFDSSEIFINTANYSVDPTNNPFLQLNGWTETIPTNAVLNTPLRARIISESSQININETACGPLTYGRTIDFSVFINEPTPNTATILSANILGSSIKLEWKALNNNEQTTFIIEKSKDGKDYFAIGQTETLYEYEDPYPFYKNPNIYRIKIINKDNFVSYSNVVIIHLEQLADATLSIYPNPMHDFFNISTKYEFEGSYKLINAMGQEILSETSLNIQENGSVSIPFIKDIPAGVYLIILKDKKGRMTTKRLQKI